MSIDEPRKRNGYECSSGRFSLVRFLRCVDKIPRKGIVGRRSRMLARNSRSTRLPAPRRVASRRVASKHRVRPATPLFARPRPVCVCSRVDSQRVGRFAVLASAVYRLLASLSLATRARADLGFYQCQWGGATLESKSEQRRGRARAIVPSRRIDRF